MLNFRFILSGEMLGQLKPAYLALIVGLVLVEEISLSWTNVVMMVQACPSISAYSVSRDSGSDWIRKFILLTLALAGATTGKAQVVLTMIGILSTCAILLANIGARAWYFFQWQPLGYQGPFATVLAYMAAIVAGLAVPFLSHRTASVGGKPAIESILKLAILLALCFVVSDFDSVQKYIIIGKEVRQATSDRSLFFVDDLHHYNSQCIHFNNLLQPGMQSRRYKYFRRDLVFSFPLSFAIFSRKD